MTRIAFLGVLMATVLTSTVSTQPAAITVGIADRVNQYVSIASEGEFVALAWAASKPAGGTDVYAATSRDGGRSFSEPARVNGTEGQADAGGEQPPQVIVARVAGTTAVTVVWTAKSAAGTRLLTARSTDDGRTFSPAAVVAGSDAAGNRGWESVTSDATGRMFVLWLDHREMAKQATAVAPHHHGESTAAPESTDGAAHAQASQLYFASIGHGIAARGLARGVCYCCKTALVSGPGGSIVAAWRHVYPGNRRDMAFTMSRDGGRTFSAPVRVSEDDWQLNGCPENGPTLALDRQQRIHIVWPTLVREHGHETLALFHASSSDGQSFTSRVALPVGGAAYHPKLATMADGSLIVTWDEVVDGARRIRVARGRPDQQGRVSFAPVNVAVPMPAQYPALVSTPSGAVIAWSTGSSTASRIAVARIPL